MTKLAVARFNDGKFVITKEVGPPSAFETLADTVRQVRQDAERGTKFLAAEQAKGLAAFESQLRA